MKKGHKKHRRHKKSSMGVMVMGLSIPALVVGAAIGVMLAKKGMV